MKRINYLFTFILLLFVSIVSVNASNKINKISMDIYVDKEGNAHFTEVWDAKLSEGTEGYHPYYNMGNSNIVDFSVKDDKGNNYTYNSNWDINDSFESKKYKNGIYKTGNEVDLCFGISEYGNRTYTLKYTIKNFIYNTNDGTQILFWQLIPYEMKPKPSDVYIKIHADERFADTLDVWGYGNKGGTAYVYDGYIEMGPPENGLKSSDYMTILVKFPANYFQTDNKINKSWDEVFKGAEDGADKYNPDEVTFWDIISMFFWPAVVIGSIILVVIFGKSDGKIKNKVYPKKDVLPFRDLPFKDDYARAYLIADEYKLLKQKTDFLGSLLLKWIKDDNVSVTTEEKGIFKNKNTKIEFKKAPTDSKELEMYNMMKTAAKDNILESNEFKKYCSNNYSKVLNWFDSLLTYEYQELSKDTKFIGPVMVKNKQIQGATVELNEKASHMAGLKKFFKEFTSMKDKKAIEVKMWRDYLIYAQIFGMAKEVAKEFKNLYPEVITDDMYNNVILINTFSSTGVSAASAARSRAQSYSSGGGGFSSGGGGGGSFGGGGGGGGFR